MKTLMLFLLFGSITVFAQERDFFTYFDEKSGKDCIIGECNRSAFYDTLYSVWFNEEYDNYEIDAEEISNFKKEILLTDIIVVMGTWCSDSRREVPRLLKILDYVSYPSENLKIIGVNREKKGLDIETDNLNIKFVPTIIFYKKGEEIGRIIETPSETLEKDIGAIILQSKE